jgi:hypothetical protein
MAAAGAGKYHQLAKRKLKAENFIEIKNSRLLPIAHPNQMLPLSSG